MGTNPVRVQRTRDLIPIPGHPMYSIDTDGNIWSDHVGRYIRQTVRTYNRSGYRRVGFLVSSNPKRYKFWYVHQLVMLAFVGPCPEGLEIDHIDLDTGNNSVGNLRYVTHQENVKSRRHSNQHQRRRRRPRNEVSIVPQHSTRVVW